MLDRDAGARDGIVDALSAAAGVDADAEGSIRRFLRAARTHLGMDIAFAAEFTGGQRVFRVVDSGVAVPILPIGSGDPLEDSYCMRVVDGRLPEVIPDASVNAEALTLAVTGAVPIGAHIDVPIRFSDGTLYGTFCCFSTHAKPSLNERDAGVMHMLAELTARIIEGEQQAARAETEARNRIRAVLDGDGLDMALQPIVDLTNLQVVGVEALSRFGVPDRTPDAWFTEATELGLANELETLAISTALGFLDQIPPNAYLSINVAPAVLMVPEAVQLLTRSALDRVVLELTEHAQIDDYPALLQVLARLRGHGARVAVDDVGSGYASLRHIVDLAPEIIKADLTLTRDINNDPARRAMMSALVNFSSDNRATLIAEGIETVKSSKRCCRSVCCAARATTSARRHSDGFPLEEPVETAEPLDALPRFAGVTATSDSCYHREARKVVASRPVRRILSSAPLRKSRPLVAAIPLGRPLPAGSSGLPGGVCGRAVLPLCGLAPGGICRAAGSAWARARSAVGGGTRRRKPNQELLRGRHEPGKGIGGGELEVGEAT